MIKNIITLVLNDFAVSFNNKSIFLILFIPFFIIISVKLTDRSGLPFNKISIGLIQNEIYPSLIMKNMAAADKSFMVYRVSLVDGMQRLKDRKLDGILLKNTKEPESLKLLVLRRESFQTSSILASFSALQKTAAGVEKNWISDIKTLQEGGVQEQMLATWVLMMVLLVSCIIIPAQVAEEKEKKLLIGLLQTPMRETEWLIAKLLTGLILINTAVMILHWPVGYKFIKNPGYILFLEAGSFCFISFGILLGFLCRTQASARTLGFLFYLPLLIPSALSDFSIKLNKIAFFIPSYQLYNPLRSILLENSRLSSFWQDWMFLLLLGVVTLSFSYTLMKRRWLM
jgi:ABC-2 type transport system permease protein